MRDYEVVDAYPFGVSFKWDKDGEIVTSEVFERNGLIPRAKMLTFFRYGEKTIPYPPLNALLTSCSRRHPQYPFVHAVLVNPGLP